MLGHMVLKALAQEKEWEVKGVDSRNFDVETFTQQDVSVYEYVINCIGVLSGSDEAQMQAVNAEFPHRLAKATSAKIINMSTDGVFSGRPSPHPLPKGEGGRRPGEGYDEDSPADSTDAYGKSKLEGEVNAPNVINIRTSIIGSSPNKKKGLLEWFLSQPDGWVVKGFTNHIWNGVTTLQFAQLCEKIIKTGAFNALRKESSVFHFAPNGPMTKYELLVLFKKVFKKNISVEPTEDPRGSVERVLKTKYEWLERLFSHGNNMEEALKQLNQFSPP
ncbi:MAG: dTDP-4-dehydrorhamnose reductase (L-QuiNAc synthase) [Parcubacteria group bacterium GW2011_GWC2_45_7]|nr:MAG: dTDP-4-dehydrorhamnose reductase (L-QuiNAc synthase) [Parcubacteria group bacterium GW2011_GWC2_45_7]KKU74105.1 MAG: dTDP-4-dehydrorhamnose reductase (L-QuiNAc synthase) [Parcubacteria group bacterium GW2011_GWA2_47_26]